jgi:predicted polyphosphate/ATP-dependent NAD kinase
MEPDTLYLLGPGTTVRAVADAMELPKTLLGVDAVYDGALVSEDVNEQEMLTLFEQYEKRSIIVTPIGGNGFIFGRGNKQFTPEVIRRVGKEQITVVSTRKKLKGAGCLRVDTGDFALDQMLCGYIQVTVGYRQSRMIKVRCD